MNELSQRIASLSPAKRALLERRLENSAVTAHLQPIARSVDMGSAQLSFAQQRLWFLDQFEPASAVYNTPRILRLRGPLNVPALEGSLREFVRRHEVLRTSFANMNGQPRPVLHDATAFGLAVTDLRSLPEIERESEARRLAVQEIGRPFDLSQDLMLRAQLWLLGEQDHMLAVTMHHIASDGWSRGVFLRELSALYAAYSSDQPSPLPELAIQYGDYAVWQRNWLEGAVLERQLAYWKQQLSGAPAAMELPTDHPRSDSQGYRGGSQKLVLSAELTQSLQELSRREEVTPFMTLLAAFHLLLSRLSGQQDVSVGAPISGRNRSEVEGLAGMFVNTLVLRTDLSGNPTFRELLQREREVTLGAYAHQDLPFEKLVEEINPPRLLDRHPLCEVLLNYLNVPWQQPELLGLDCQSLDLGEPPSKFLMTLYVRPAQELRLNLVYREDLFTAERMRLFLAQFAAVLEKAVTAPHLRLDAFSLITPECRRMLPDPTLELDEPAHLPVTRLFRDWSERRPGQIAVTQGERQWSYEDVQRMSEGLARELVTRGVRPGDVVALHGTRNPGTIVGMLGVLASRCVLLLVDADLPAGRKALMLDEAAPQVLIEVASSPWLKTWCREHPGMIRLELDPENAAIADGNSQELAMGAHEDPQGDDAAYIFFTSGTTGIPKGIVGCHKGLSHFLDWQRSEFAIGPDDRIAQLTSLSFDPVLRDTFLPLTSGGTICLPETADCSRILSWLQREKVTVVHAVPSLAGFWLDHSAPHSALPALRYVFFAGEPLTDVLVGRWRQALSDTCSIVNLYGPTETTMVKCYYRLPTDLLHGVQPIGRPLPNTQALILSETNRQCGVGETGEIVLRTPFRTLGYLRSTGRKGFANNPFREDEADQLYFTGDRGRYRPDGALEILGRLDDQVKIHGVRVEPSEIAAILNGHPAVRTCVVSQVHRHSQLAVYVVLDEQLDISIAQLRSYLADKFPMTWASVSFTMLDRIPLNANGKVDYKSLPEPEGGRSELAEAYVAPRTPVEELLSEVWKSVLGVEQVGIHDNFFELGGHSLLAMRMISRLRDACALDLPVRSLFESPTVAELGGYIERRCSRESSRSPLASELKQRLAGLSPEKRAALQRKLLEQSRTGYEPLKRIDRERIDRLPLSFAQERLWFFDQFEPESAVYNIPRILRLRGPLNVPALERSLREFVRRQEALRTSYANVNGQPQPVLLDASAFGLAVTELRSLPEIERESEARRLAVQEIGQPFDLSQDLMLRAQLWRLGEQDHVLAVTMHHIASDGWSMGVFCRELSTLYTAYSSDQPSPLPDLPIQYVDYAVWQRKWLQGAVLERQLTYWKQQLSGAPVLLELPTDFPRPTVQRYRGGTLDFALTPELTKSLEGLSRQEEVTLFMTLLAAFQLLLSRLSGQEDVSVGAPIAGRNRTEVEDLVGMFVNTLVLRSDLSGNPTFQELLRRVREVTLGAYAHQDLPFEKLVEELQPERNLGHSPLFQVMFVLQNAPASPLELPGLSVIRLGVDNRTAKFDLLLSLQETTNGLRGKLEYNSDLFEAETIARLVGHFEVLLEGIVADPATRIGALPLLTEPERRQLLVDWNDTAMDYPQDKCIHELFEEQVERMPEAVAVEFQEKTLTYGELNARANQLAHHLIGLGGGPEVLVGLCVKRSLEMFVGLLGILKAGAACVPLDPTLPFERLAFLVEDTQVALVLTQQILSEESLPLSPKRFCLDADWPTLKCCGSENPNSHSTPDDLAYVIYTSGSSGRPKGVAMHQRPLVNLIQWQMRALPLAPEQRVAQFAALSFDVSFQEMFSTWCSGGSLFVVPEPERRDPALLVAFLARNQIHRVFLPFTALSQFAEAATPVEIDRLTLREIITAGEQLQLTAPIQYLLAQLPACVLHNHYGPSETHVVTAFALDGSTEVGSVLPPIGRSIANASVYVLDARQEPVPVGVPGELYIGGVALARGYLNRPELTADRFVADPFNKAPDTRVYRTGDLVRWRADGNLEFLGRLDRQVKLRGFRIELGEIEAVLAQHPTVQQAVVLLREDRPGDQRLAAYIVPQPTESPFTTTELRRHLQAKLPAYMVPWVFVALDALPLTSNGKIDRKALPAPESDRGDLPHSYAGPRTPAQELIVGIWESVLGVEPVGIHDNFFELGGHSLLATQLISRLRDAFAFELPLRSLFEGPTVAELGWCIEGKRFLAPVESIPPLARVPRQGALPLSFAQERLWFFDQFEPASSVYNIPRILRLRGPLNVPALQRSLREFVRRHEVLRTSFTNVNGQPQTVLHDEAAFGLTVTDLRSVPAAKREAEAERLAVQEVVQPSDLSQDLMLRAQLWVLGEQDHVLAVTMHHIASDGWSLGVFMRELSALYAAYSSDQPSPLPELPIQYLDYAIWQRKWLLGPVLDQQLAYWKQQLSGAQVLELPTDCSRPAVQSYRGGSEQLVLSVELTQSIQELSRREDVTPFMVLLAAFQLLLSRFSGQEDVSVGAPIAGRNRTEVEGLAGMFVNTLVLRTDLSGNPMFSELLRREREVTLGAYAHQDLPFEKLVEELNPPRLLDRHPLCEVLLNYLNVPWQRPELPGLDCQSLDLGESQSKFLMTLYVAPARELRLNLVYRQELFTAERMRLFLAQLVAVLEQAVADPQLPLDAFSLITPECRGLLPDPTLELAEPAYLPVTRLFRDWSERTPGQIAVSQGERQWTYKDVQRMSEGLARKLATLRVRPGDVVALHGTRSLGTIVGMLGVLASRGVLLLVDADLPAGRKALMLDEAEPKVLVEVGSSPWLDTWCREHPGVMRVELDPETSAISNGNSQELAVGVHENPQGDDAAYIFFTSGTTGTPKGIVGCHKSLSHFLDWQRTEFAMCPGDRIAQLTSLSFDVVMREVFLPLTCGGTLCLPDGNEPLDLTEMLSWLKRRRITVLHTVRSLVEFGLDGQASDLLLPELRCVFFVGEPLTDRLVKRLRGVITPDCEIINLYGTTETGPAKCFYRVPAQPLLGIQPIGQAIPGSQALLLADRTRLCGVGELGEVAVRTPFLARGYLKAVGENGFAPNPFRNDSADRVYFTGDRGRYRPEGTLEILGRRDDQVKIRGVRIEPQEIARVLVSHPSVRTCAVLPITKDHDTYLAAYVIPQPSAEVKSNELRIYLANHLMSAMVPSAFIQLDDLPLTPTGKVDRAALPVPEAPDTMADVIAPRNVLEAQLTRIWEDVLNVRPIGVCDNFFELGGHSLVAVKLFDRVARVTGQSLPLATLFECPTIRHLADVLCKRNWSPPWKSLVAIQPGGSKPPLFVVPPAGGSVLRFAELARHLGPDQPVYGLEPLGHDDLHPPQDRVEDMASLYLKEIRELHPTGPCLLAGRCFGTHVVWEMARQLSAQGCHVALVALLDAGAPANGRTWSPTRRTIKYYGQRVMHHLATGRLLRVVLNHASARLKWIRSWRNATGRRHLRLLDAHRRAQVSYVGRPFAGRVVLLQSEEYSGQPVIHERWFELATGNFDTVVIPGTTHRDLLLGGRFTPTLAKHLREHLDRAVCEPLSCEPTVLPFKNGSHITVPNAARRAA